MAHLHFVCTVFQMPSCTLNLLFVVLSDISSLNIFVLDRLNGHISTPLKRSQVKKGRAAKQPKVR